MKMVVDVVYLANILRKHHNLPYYWEISYHVLLMEDLQPMKIEITKPPFVAIATQCPRIMHAYNKGRTKCLLRSGFANPEIIDSKTILKLVF